MSQVEIPLHDVVLVSDEIVARQPSVIKALITSADIAGMEEKEAAAAAGIDPATWSKIKSKQAYFPICRVQNYCQRTGNWLGLQRLNYECGFGVQRLESVQDRKIRELQDALDKERQMRRYAEDMLTRRAS